MAQIIIARRDFNFSKQSCTGSVTSSLRGFFVFQLRILVSRTPPANLSRKLTPFQCTKFLASTPTPASVLLCDHNAPNWVRISLRAAALCISFCRSTVIAASLSALSTCSATRSTSCYVFRLAGQDSGVWTSSRKPLANLSRLSALDTTSFSVDTHHSSSSALRTQRAQLAIHAPSLRSTVIAATNSRIWSSMETGEN